MQEGEDKPKYLEDALQQKKALSRRKKTYRKK